MITETLKRVQRARTTMLIDMPFFGVLVLQLHVKEDPSCQTAWTDGQSMGFNPTFVASLSSDQLIALIAHEVMHCACGHPWRESGRQHQRWNAAADYAINPILVDAGLKLPDGGLIDAAYHGKSAEWIYDRLPNKPDDGSNAGNDPTGQGEVRNAPASAAGDQPAGANDKPQPGNSAGAAAGDSDDQAPMTESDWQQLTKQAIQAAKSQGKLPGKMLRDLEEATKPLVDWRSLLRRYMQDITTADYSWTRPNRRYLTSGLYLPSLCSPACGKIAIAVDTSGSIDAVTLAQFAGEMQAIIDEMQPSSVDVLYCDAEVNRVDTFERGEHIEMHPCGGGGTSFVPVFDHYAAADAEPPVVLVYFTDMYGSFPAAADFPTIWASTSSTDTAPFGDVVPINQ
jgi:predicted metal-dependent peptidase